MLNLGPLERKDMSDAIESSPELVPEPGLIQALRADVSTAEKLAVLARLRRRVEENRASLHEHARSFNEMCDEARRNLPSEGLVQPAAGEIDYAELSREHIARYPKIRAALTK
jgi:hypothetical protein